MAKLNFADGRTRETTYQLVINKPNGFTHQAVVLQAGERAMLSPTVTAEVCQLLHLRKGFCICATKIVVCTWCKLNELKSISNKVVAEIDSAV